MWKDVITADAWKTYEKSVRNRLLKLTQHKETSQDHNFYVQAKTTVREKIFPLKYIELTQYNSAIQHNTSIYKTYIHIIIDNT